MEERYAAGQRVAVMGIAGNLLLAAGKLTVGLLFSSQAMTADGFNSFGDVLASAVTLLGSRAAARPADDDHPYGHGKAEYIATALIGLMMLAVAAFVLRGAAVSLTARAAFVYSPLLFVVAAVTITGKLALYLYTRHFGLRYHSLLITANATDHRNDMLVTAGTLLGLLGGLGGLWWLDGVMGCAISLWLGASGFGLLRSAVNVLMDTVIDPAVVAHLEEHIRVIPGVSHIDSIRSKPVGMRYILLIKVSVPGELTVFESHRIAGIIKEELVGHGEVADVVVHINPDTPHTD
jgi:cation diffusion facilitator family transporter